MCEITHKGAPFNVTHVYQAPIVCNTGVGAVEQTIMSISVLKGVYKLV